MTNNFIIVLMVSVMVVSCASTKAASHGDEEVTQQTFVSCDKRTKEKCTTDYNPVCAQVDTGRRCITVPCEGVTKDVTMTNACVACGTKKVWGYTPGKCVPNP